MQNRNLKFVVPDECDRMSAKVFLKKHCNVSARMLAQLKRENEGILRNNKIIKTIDTVYSGDIIELNLPKDCNNIVPTKGELDILYEDDYLIALDKPYNMTVHPTKIYQENTLANYLSYYQKTKGESYTVRVINRLDKDTSGIVIVAKNKFVASYLFNNLKKTYIALCEGIICGSSTIDKPIRLLEGHTVQRTTAADGKRAITHYKAISHSKEHTLLEITLETGRTHQIRCHLSSIGHPLAGDDMYGGSLKFISRQALHCNKVIFTHPINHNVIEIKSQLSNDISEAMLKDN